MFASTRGSRPFPNSSNGPTSAPGFRETLCTTSSFQPTRESARVTLHRTRLQVRPYGSSRTGRFETGRNSLTSTRTRVPWAFPPEQYSRNVSRPSPPDRRRLLGPYRPRLDSHIDSAVLEAREDKAERSRVSRDFLRRNDTLL